MSKVALPLDLEQTLISTEFRHTESWDPSDSRFWGQISAKGQNQITLLEHMNFRQFS